MAFHVHVDISIYRRCNPDARRGTEGNETGGDETQLDWMKLNMFSFDMSNINIFIAKSFSSPHFSFSSFFFGKRWRWGWHFLYIYFMPFHYWLCVDSHSVAFSCLLFCDKKKLGRAESILWSETWKIHNFFRPILIKRRWKRRKVNGFRPVSLSYWMLSLS